MLYRPYAANDFDPLYAIEEVCFEPPLRFSRRYMRSLVTAANAATWIAEEDGRMAGFAIVEWTESLEALLAYVQTIEIAPEQRGRGAGHELLRRVEDSALAAGAASIWLHVDEENRAAIALYQSHGYLCKDREEGYYGRGRAALIFEKALGKGPAR